MKRLSFIVMLLLALCLLFVSCDNGVKPTGEAGNSQGAPTKEATVEKSEEKTEAITDEKSSAQAVADAVAKSFPQGYDLSLDLKMGQSMSGVSVDLPVKWSILSKADGSISLQTAETEVMGISAGMKVYYTDGVCYVSTSSMGVESKYYIDENHEDFPQGLDNTYVNLGTVSAVLQDGTVKSELDALLNGASIETKDGVTVYSFDVSKTSLGALVSKLEEKGIAVDATEGQAKVAVSEDGFLSYVELDLLAEEEGMTLTVKGKITVNNSGKAVEIAAPEDLDTYVSYDEMMGDLFETEEWEPTDYDLAYEAIFELYDENMEKLSDYDAQLAVLADLYGEDTVAEAAADVEADIQSFLDLMGDLG